MKKRKEKEKNKNKITRKDLKEEGISEEREEALNKNSRCLERLISQSSGYLSIQVLRIFFFLEKRKRVCE